MTTANMGIELPVVDGTAGPDWAEKLNAGLTKVDEHDHSDGKGVKVTPAGLNITDDLPLNSHALKSAWFLELIENDTAPVVVRGLYADGNDELHYIDGSGLNTQITLGGALNLTANRGINGDYATSGDVPSLSYSDVTHRYSFFWEGSELANIVTGCLFQGVYLASGATVHLGAFGTPGVVAVDTTAVATNVVLDDAASGVPGVLFTIKDRKGTAATHNITVTASGTDKIDGASSKVINTNYGVLRLVSDGVSSWMVI